MGRYDLTEKEWLAIQPHLPNKPRGVPRVDDRRVLNGIFWVLRSGAFWSDLPERYGPPTTIYNRFNRWRKAGVWDRLMDAITELHDGDVQMIDTSIVRVHQHGATAKRGVEIAVWVAPEAASHQDPRARRRPGPPNQAPAHCRRKERHRQCGRADRRSPEGAMLLADKGYDANALREAVRNRKAWENIPPKANRRDPVCFSKHLYKARNRKRSFFTPERLPVSLSSSRA